MRRALFALLLTLASSAHATAADQLLKQAQTIALDGVNGRIDHCAADVTGKRLYIAALGNDTVEVIDVDEGKRISSIGGLKKPTGIRVLPGSRNVVIASGDDGKVTIYAPDL